MPARIRQCVECSECRTRYVIGFSPYENGTYLLCRREGNSELYVLLCSCGEPFSISRLAETVLARYVVPIGAYQRGYGSPQEIVPLACRNLLAPG
jgi:hypothetical protein